MVQVRKLRLHTSSQPVPRDTRRNKIIIIRRRHHRPRLTRPRPRSKVAININRAVISKAATSSKVAAIMAAAEIKTGPDIDPAIAGNVVARQGGDF